MRVGRGSESAWRWEGVGVGGSAELRRPVPQSDQLEDDGVVAVEELVDFLRRLEALLRKMGTWLVRSGWS